MLIETCPYCAGTGCDNHPDSGQVCFKCNGSGGIIPRATEGQNMFAKLFTTSKGQFLIQKTEGEEPFTFDLTLRYDVESPIPEADVTMTSTYSFPATDEGEEARDKTFDEFDEAAAEARAQQGM